MLVIGIGNATKSLGKYLLGEKCYKATGLMGIQTDTDDKTGQSVFEKPWENVTEEQMQAAIRKFTGTISQVQMMMMNSRCR